MDYAQEAKHGSCIALLSTYAVTNCVDSAAQTADSPVEVCPFAFAAPLAPLVAARAEGRSLDLRSVASAVRDVAERHEVTLVEGAGGLLVPVGTDWTMADLAVELALPMLVVARAGLGTVNQTLLTVAEARRRGLRVLGIVLNGLEDESTPTNGELIESFGSAPVLARLPYLDDPRLARLEAVATLLDTSRPAPIEEEAHA